MSANKLFFSASFFEKNRKKLRGKVQKQSLIVISANGLLQKSADEPYPFSQDANFWYLTGINQPEVILVIDGAEEYLILPDLSDYSIVFHGDTDAEAISLQSGVKNVYNHQDGWRRLSKSLRNVNLVATMQPLPPYVKELNLYINPARISLVNSLNKYNKKVKIADLSLVFAEMRSSKEKVEIDAIKKASRNSIELHRHIARNIDTVQSESELKRQIDLYAIENNQELAYSPIVASGDNATILHYTEGKSKISKQKGVLIDAALRSSGYCSDISRTYCTRPSGRFKDVYKAVSKVKEFAIGKLAKGVVLSEYEKKVENYMGKKLLELGLIKINKATDVRRYYPHRTSHHIGINPHDPADPLSPVLENAVLSVEPGIYIKDEGIGIRQEDTVVVTSEKVLNLTGKLPEVVQPSKI